MIAAEPGFYFVALIQDVNDMWWVDEFPIVGWELTKEGTAEPVTLYRQYPDKYRRVGVLAPNGKVYDDGDVYANIASWREEFE